MNTNAPKSPTRISSLDGLRGVACVAVLLLHIGLMIEPFGPSKLYDLMPGTAAVMVFYVLSGVVLSLLPLKYVHPLHEAHTKDDTAHEGIYDWFAYYPRRIVRLCIPLFAAILIGVVAGFIGHALGSTTRTAVAVDYSGSPDTILHDLFMQFDLLFNVSSNEVTLYQDPLVRINSPVWSMSWELWFSILLPLCIFFVLLFKRTSAIVMVLIVGIFVAHFSGYFPLRFAIMFVLGAFIAKRVGTLAQKQFPVILELAVLLICVATIEAACLGEDGAWNALVQTAMNVACAALVVIALTHGVVRRALDARPCQWLGKISYSLYLTHALVIGTLQVLLSRFAVPAPAVAVIALGISLAFAWAFWYCIERPSILWSHRIGKTAASMENPR